MARILAVSDPHYHNYKEHSTLLNGVNSRLIDVDIAMKSAIAYGIEKGCTHMTLSGDMFQERGRIKPSVFNMAFRRINFCATKMPVIMSIGNHDMEDFALGASAIDTFDSINNCYVMGGTKGYSMLGVRGLKVLGIQYFHKTEDFKAIFEKALKEEDKPDVILIHQGIDDFRYSGMPETKITASYISSLTDAWVLCGHYHTPNKLDRVVNVGAPLQHNFGDEGNERGCWIIDTDTNEYEFHPLNVTPKFLTARTKAEAGASHVKGSFVRIIAKSPRTGETLNKVALDAGAATTMVRIDKEYKPAHEKTVTISSDPKVMVADYCKLEPRFAPHVSNIVNLYEKVCL